MFYMNQRWDSPDYPRFERTFTNSEQTGETGLRSNSNESNSNESKFERVGQTNL